MRKIWDWIKDNPNRAMFIVPIILVVIISISHVVSWYDIMNPYNWAIYLSIAIEVGAMTALVAATNKIKGGVWLMFGLVTFIQMIGNIFFSFKEIDANGDLFKSWMELTGPVWEMLGSDVNDVVVHKRWLAFLGGGLLPIISLTSLHFFIKYEDPNKTNVEEKNQTNNVEINKENIDINTINKIIKDYQNLQKTITTTTHKTYEPEIINEEIIENGNEENFRLIISNKNDENITEENITTTTTTEIQTNETTTTTTEIQTNETTTTTTEIQTNETTTTTTEGKRILTYTKEQ